MEAFLLEDSIFSDPTLLESADNPHLCLHISCPEDEGDLYSEHKKANTSQAKTSQAKAKSLDKQERENLVAGLRTVSAAQLVDVVVDKLSGETHMQYYLERESLLDSSYD